MIRSQWLVVLSFCGACTIVYNADNLPPATDSRVVDAVPIDADPTQLALTSIDPLVVNEGVGSGGSRPALFVLHGSSLVGSAVITAELVGGGTITVMTSDAVADGTEAGVAMRIPVLTDLGANAMRTLRVTVTQGTTIKTIDAMVRGLDELTTASGTITAAATPQLYSRIDITSAVHFIGPDPVRLAATADIHIGAKVDGDAVGVTPGPHGCAGGVTASPGQCTPGGGDKGVTATGVGLSGGGGGGAGFGVGGTGGSGTGGGEGGQLTGVAMLVPFGSDGNRGNGGGGGGSATAGVGSPGAGGGGSIALTAGGDLVVDGTGAVSVAGGVATAGGGGVAGGGGGGGGSGGAILIRIGGAMAPTSNWLSATGGTAPTGANAGGPGSVGRIRVDQASGTVSGSTPSTVRGPMWAVATPLIANSTPTLTLTGGSGLSLGIRVNDIGQTDVSVGASGTVAVQPTGLQIGRNQVCAVARVGLLVDESLACVDLYLTGL